MNAHRVHVNIPTPLVLTELIAIHARALPIGQELIAKPVINFKFYYLFLSTHILIHHRFLNLYIYRISTDGNLCRSSSPCQNGGTCSYVSMNVYTCSCVTGWAGTNCEEGKVFDFCVRFK